MNQQHEAYARYCYVKEGRREGGDKEEKSGFKGFREINTM